MSANATVFVVDDDRDMRNSLKWLIESVGLAVETFASAEEFLTANPHPQPGCLLLDVRMPGMGGLRLLEHLQTVGARLPVIVCTGHGDISMAVQALKSGAFDFVEKPANHQQILDRIQEALTVDRDRHARESERANFKKRLGQLSPREHQILERVVAGISNKRIAQELGLSERTVEKHRESVKDKTETNSLAELIRMVVLYGSGAGKD